MTSLLHRFTAALCGFRHPVYLILVVGLIAMGGALRATFYLDDHIFILNGTGSAPNTFRLTLGSFQIGDLSAGAREFTIFQIIPTILTLLTNWLFPMSTAAAHSWNLLIHLAFSVMVFRLGKRLLERLCILGSDSSRHQAALWGALIFACHPIGTEPVHYAKCHLVQLVALFGFWASCAAVEFVSTPSRRRRF